MSFMFSSNLLQLHEIQWLHITKEFTNISSFRLLNNIDNMLVLWFRRDKEVKYSENFLSNPFDQCDWLFMQFNIAYRTECLAHEIANVTLYFRFDWQYVYLLFLHPGFFSLWKLFLLILLPWKIQHFQFARQSLRKYNPIFGDWLWNWQVRLAARQDFSTQALLTIWDQTKPLLPRSKLAITYYGKPLY